MTGHALDFCGASNPDRSPESVLWTGSAAWLNRMMPKKNDGARKVVEQRACVADPGAAVPAMVKRLCPLPANRGSVVEKEAWSCEYFLGRLAIRPPPKHLPNFRPP